MLSSSQILDQADEKAIRFVRADDYAGDALFP